MTTPTPRPDAQVAKAQWFAFPQVNRLWAVRHIESGRRYIEDVSREAADTICLLLEQIEAHALALREAERRGAEMVKALSAKAVCHGCDIGWTVEVIEGDRLHVIPNSLRTPPTEFARGTHMGCDAEAIWSLPLPGEERA